MDEEYKYEKHAQWLSDEITKTIAEYRKAAKNEKPPLEAKLRDLQGRNLQFLRDVRKDIDRMLDELNKDKNWKKDESK